MAKKEAKDLIARLLEIRKIIKRKKPDFIRQDAHKKPRLGFKWRKPRGKQSKMRLRKKGHRKMPTPGYGSPKEVEGLLWNGLRPIVVHNVKELNSLDANKHIVIIASTVGLKKKLQIFEEATKKGLKVLYYTKEKLDAKIKAKKEKKKEKKEKVVASKGKESNNEANEVKQESKVSKKQASRTKKKDSSSNKKVEEKKSKEKEVKKE